MHSNAIKAIILPYKLFYYNEMNHIKAKAIIFNRKYFDLINLKQNDLNVFLDKNW